MFFVVVFFLNVFIFLLSFCLPWNFSLLLAPCFHLKDQIGEEKYCNRKGAEFWLLESWDNPQIAIHSSYIHVYPELQNYCKTVDMCDIKISGFTKNDMVQIYFSSHDVPWLQIMQICNNLS